MIFIWSALFLCFIDLCVAQANLRPWTLRQTIEKSLEKNLDLKIAEFSTQESEAQVLRRTGEFDWLLNGNFSKNHQSTPASSALDGVEQNASLVTSGTSFGGGVNKRFSFGPRLAMNYSFSESESNSSYAAINPSYSVSLSVDLEFSILKLLYPSYFRRNLEQAEADWKMAQLRWGEKLSETILKSVDLHLQLAEAQQAFEFSRQTHRHAQQTLELLTQKQRLGSASKIDFLDAQSAEKKAFEATLRAQQTLEQCKEALRLYTLEEINEVVIFEFKNEPLPAPSQAPERSEMQRARLEVEKAALGLQTARRELWPEFTAKVRFGSAGLDSSYSLSQQAVTGLKFPSYSMNLAASMPLERSAARGGFRSSELRHQMQMIRLAQAERQMQQEARKWQRQYDSSLLKIQALEEACRAQDENLKAKTAFHKSGRISTSELNRAVDAKLQADLELLKARSERVQAHFGLAKLRGTLREEIARLVL